MLKTRIVTALALLAVILPTVWWAPAWGFQGLMLAVVVLASWEWARLNPSAQVALDSIINTTNTESSKPIGISDKRKLRSSFALYYAAIVAFLGMGIWSLGGAVLQSLSPLWWLGLSALWLFLGSYILKGGGAAWLALPRWSRLAFGALSLLATWLVVVQMRAVGLNFLLSALALVWIADTGAYFAGRTLGGRFVKRKLAPNVSPNKTWEGVFGGFIAMILLSIVWLQIESGQGWSPSSMQILVGRWGWMGFALIVAAVLGLSIIGDLHESLQKRAANVKDSSRLLPGHGGFLDRVDALLPSLSFILGLCLL